MSVDFISYNSNFLSNIFPSSRSKYGIEAAAFNQINKAFLKNIFLLENIEKIEMSKEEQEKLEKICNQFLG